MKKRILIPVIAFALSLCFSVSADTETMTKAKSKIIAIDTSQVAKPAKGKCSDSNEAMSECRSFIKGFLYGALRTDAAIIKSIESSEPTFAERAMRTRLGKRSDSPTALAGFCLPADRSILSIAEETLSHVKSSERNSAELAQSVHSSLKVDYPCE